MDIISAREILSKYPASTRTKETKVAYSKWQFANSLYICCMTCENAGIRGL